MRIKNRGQTPLPGVWLEDEFGLFVNIDYSVAELMLNDSVDETLLLSSFPWAHINYAVNKVKIAEFYAVIVLSLLIQIVQINLTQSLCRLFHKICKDCARYHTIITKSS